jgi:hypothetical protein
MDSFGSTLLGLQIAGQDSGVIRGAKGLFDFFVRKGQRLSKSGSCRSMPCGEDQPDRSPNEKGVNNHGSPGSTLSPVQTTQDGLGGREDHPVSVNDKAQNL